MSGYLQKWSIVSFLEQVPAHHEFNSSEWPLHVTLADVFAIGLDGTSLYREVERMLGGRRPVTTTVGQRAVVGTPQKPVPVMLVHMNDELLSLHGDIISLLDQKGAVYNEPQYVGDGHAAHYAYRQHDTLRSGASVTLDSVSLIDMFPDNDGMKRRVVGTVQLGI